MAFGTGVLVAAMVALGIALLVTAPKKAPDFALDSKEIWHAEIGLAFFITLYIAIVAVMLAWQGKGFTKLAGPGGLSAEADEVMKLQESSSELRNALANLQASTITNNDRLVELDGAVGDLHSTVDKLASLLENSEGSDDDPD
jgi:hypothetical protein